MIWMKMDGVDRLLLTCQTSQLRMKAKSQLASDALVVGHPMHYCFEAFELDFRSPMPSLRTRPSRGDRQDIHFGSRCRQRQPLPPTPLLAVLSLLNLFVTVTIS